MALFVDIAGFTTMSEALGRLGTAGTEELTTILNDSARPAIALAQSYGGSVAAFGGDAMTVLFRHPQTRPRPAARRAVQCALELQRIGGARPSIDSAAGQFGLSVRIGVASGQVTMAVVDGQERLLCVFAGDVLDRCVEAEQLAQPGEVVVHKGLLAHLDAVTAVATDPYRRMCRLMRRVPSRPAKPPPGIPKELDRDLSRFLHPVIAQRVEAGHASFVNEHRKVTTIFVHSNAGDDGLAIPCDSHASLDAVVSVASRFEGSLQYMEGSARGWRVMVTFGAPVAHDDDETRALACALELHRRATSPLRMGISTGLVFCGLVGSSRRSEYTVIGDAVNVAARLMQTAAWQQILVDGATRQAASPRFVWRDLGPVWIRGKDTPIPVAAVEALLDAPAFTLRTPAHALPLVGRSRELRRASAALDAAWSGHGRVMIVTGEPGVGKSRLGGAITQVARERGFSVHVGACEPYGTRASYLGWRDVWWSLLGLEAEPALSGLCAVLEAIDPELLPRLPLLSPVLGLDLPDTDFTASLAPQLRSHLLRSLLLTCLTERSRRSPLLIVLEDCHWMDGPSQDLLQSLSRNLAQLPVALLLLARPSGLESAVRAGDHIEEIQLTELEAEDATALIRLTYRRALGADPDDTVIEVISAKAGGNPFFIEAIVDLLASRGRLPPGDASQPLDLPGNLASLVLARIDQLTEDQKVALKVASILGPRFPASWLAGLAPEASSAPDDLQRQLDALSRLDLIPLETTQPEPAYAFKHQTIQEVAYASLSHTTRQRLHEAAGDLIERSSRGDVAVDIDLLAWHYANSRNVTKQRIYFRLAGDRARDAYANEAAIDYYERLRALVSGTEQHELVLKLGEVEELAGRWTDAERRFREAIESPARAIRARACSALGHLLASTERQAEALTWLHEAMTEAEALSDIDVMSHTLDRLTQIHFHRSEYHLALDYAEAHLRLAAEHHDDAGTGAALENLGNINWVLGDLAAALSQLQRARQLAEANNDWRVVAHAANDLAGLYADQGDYRLAVHYLHEAADVARRIGYLQVVGISLGNEAELRQAQGDYTGALACALGALQTLVELGDLSSVPMILDHIADAFAATGRPRHAEEMYQRTIAVSRALNEFQSLCEALQSYAELCASQGRLDEAGQLNDEAGDLASQVREHGVCFRALLLRIRLARMTRTVDISQTVAALRALLPIWTRDVEQAAIHYQLWRIDPALDESRQVAASLYAQLHQAAPDLEYRQRHEELTGHPLDDPPALPPLPTAEQENLPDLQALLRHIDAQLDRSAALSGLA